jgi:hypothetical protein
VAQMKYVPPMDWTKTEVFFSMETTPEAVQARVERSLNPNKGAEKVYRDGKMIISNQPDQTGFMIGSVRLA